MKGIIPKMWMAKDFYLGLTARDLEMPAELFHFYGCLLRYQTPDGHIERGRSLGYAWFRSRIPACKSERQLKRYVSALRSSGRIATRREFRGGLSIYLPGSAKFKAAQLDLGMFSGTSAAPIPAKNKRDRNGPIGGQKWPQKEYYPIREKILNPPAQSAGDFTPSSPREKIENRNLRVHAEVESLRQAAVGLGPCYPEELLRVSLLMEQKLAATRPLSENQFRRRRAVLDEQARQIGAAGGD